MKSRIKNTLNILVINSRIILKRLVKKGIIAISILLVLLLLKIINIKATNILLNTIKSNINYEFNIVYDSKRIFNKGKDLLNNFQRVLEVYNIGEVHKYIYPLE